MLQRIADALRGRESVAETIHRSDDEQDTEDGPPRGEAQRAHEDSQTERVSDRELNRLIKQVTDETDLTTSQAVCVVDDHVEVGEDRLRDLTTWNPRKVEQIKRRVDRKRMDDPILDDHIESIFEEIEDV